MGLTADGIAFEDHAPPRATGAPLVLLHASGGSMAQWPQALRRLPGRRVLALDLPGHGSSRPPPERSVAGLARRVLSLLDELSVPRAVVAGHSLGGAVALETALVAPGRVAGLVLVGTGARLRVTPAILEAAADPARADEVGRAVAAVSFGPGAPPGLAAAYAAEIAACPPGSVHADLAACDAFDVMGRLGAISAPALVICGGEDRLTPTRYAAFLASGIRGARLATVPGAGHMVLSEAPETLVLEVDGFLGSVS